MSLHDLIDLVLLANLYNELSLFHLINEFLQRHSMEVFLLA
jgi:hypothetical protein